MMDVKLKVFETIVEKYVKDEIMTKSDFLQEQDKLFERFDTKIKWLIGTILATGIGLAGLMIALMHH